MPPEYHLQSYWNNRFEKEDQFEWLGDGVSTIIPHLSTYLQTTTESKQPPRLLHIGAGSSSLSAHIVKAFADTFGGTVDSHECVIVVTDFSDNVVEKQREAQKSEAASSWKMRWECVDALKWADLVVLTAGNCGENTGPSESYFDVVVDKSTSDAISCGEDIVFTQKNLVGSSIYPALHSYLSTHSNTDVTVPPLELLALHLATLVRTGGIWIALSYSRDRFPFLPSQNEIGAHASLDPAKYWTMETFEAVDAPSGQGRAGVHAPSVQHFVYILRRKA